MEGSDMTCVSCDKWTSQGCELLLEGFPHIGDQCEWFCYEPGVDEVEHGQEG